MEHLQWAQFAELLVTFCSLTATWTLFRVNRWLRKHLENEKQRERERIAEGLRQQNETLRILSEACASPERPTLESLLGDEKQDWSLESSQKPSDWSDDNERTECLPSKKRR